MARSRDGKRQIPELLDPSTGDRFTDIDNKKRIAHEFYSTLYSPTEPDQDAIDTLLNSIPASLHITDSEASMLQSEITIEDILKESQRSPRKSSPGSDGIPYEILNLIFRSPLVQPLILTIFNSALNDGVFPDSWNQSVMALLPKKVISRIFGIIAQ